MATPDCKNGGGSSSSDDDVPLAKKFNVKRKASPPPPPPPPPATAAKQLQQPAATASAATAAANANGDQPSTKKVKTEPVDAATANGTAAGAGVKRDREQKKKKKREKEKRREAEKPKPKPAPGASHHVKREPEKSSGGTGAKRAKAGDAAAGAGVADVWRWWEEAKPTDGSKWKFLEHRGPVFAAGYDPLPKSVKFYYDGELMHLSAEAEEAAGFYARMLDHDYTKKDVFNNNFFQDWRSVMTHEERKRIKLLDKCDFKEMHRFFCQQSEERKNRTKEEKQKLKEENERLMREYGFCTLDGHKQKIANFRIEPPGLFRGRGNHPKMGKLKRRVVPEDVIINCSKDAKIPKPPEGRKWKEVRHDNSVSWLACWVENVQCNFKYVMLNAASRLKGEKDWKKYETARQLHKVVAKIRAQYRADFKSKEMRLRQRAVALYFIDKLALRAGNEKDDDEADTVGCCSLRYEHTRLHKQHPTIGPYVVEFDFLGKDSIRYNNAVPVEKRVFKNLRLFMENKKAGDDLFDRLNTTILNAHLKELMDGLTAKVFRTYNASKTLEDQLDKLTIPDEHVAAKILSYNRANREVAILCNHQRAVPKTFEKSMENLSKKVEEKEHVVKAAKREAKAAKALAKRQKSVKNKQDYEKKKATLRRLEDQLMKLKVQKTDKDENKEIALGTSKLNYLDPRITVAWCRKYNVPVEKVYNKTQREKFQWAIDMAKANFRFQDTDSDQGTNRMEGEEDEENEEEEADS